MTNSKSADCIRRGNPASLLSKLNEAGSEILEAEQFPTLFKLGHRSLGLILPYEQSMERTIILKFIPLLGKKHILSVDFFNLKTWRIPCRFQVFLPCAAEIFPPSATT